MSTFKKIAIVPRNRYFLRLKYTILGYDVSVRPKSQHRLPQNFRNSPLTDLRLYLQMRKPNQFALSPLAIGTEVSYES